LHSLNSDVFRKGKECLIFNNKIRVNTLSYKTVSANKATAHKEWIVVDAEGHNLGRLSSKVAMLLRGKYKPNFTPHADCGDNVIVINAEKINLTGNKLDDKVYIRHTGYPGGQRTLTAKVLQAKNPAMLVEKAIKGMLPKNKLGAQLFRNLTVCVGSAHKHEAQQPKTINLNDLK